jgi:PBSX family phage terminase large subunit
MFWTLNPEAPAHWIYRDYIDRWANEGVDGYRYHHFTLDDNPAITEERKAEIAQQYSGVFYQRYILGLRVMATGLIYSEFMSRDDLAFDFSDWGEYTEMFVACDYGIQNAMVYLLFGWNTRTLRWEVVKEWRHSGRETEVQYTDAEYYSRLVEFIGDRPVRDIIIDPSASSFIAVIRKSKRYRAILADNRVVAGISYTASLFHIGKLAICRDCEGLIEELGGYVWDEKKAQRTGEEYPLAVADHGPDALRYGCFTHIRRYEKRYGIMIGKEAS